MTLVFDTPLGEKRYSSVVRASFSYPTELGFSILGDMIGAGYRMEGEALVAEVAPGMLVFALLPGTEDMLLRSIFQSFEDRKIKTRAKLRAVRKQFEPLEVPQRHWPVIVAFADIDDPNSIFQIKPGEFSDFLGDGYSLRKVTVQATKGPTTKGHVLKPLKWLDGYNEWIRFDGVDQGLISASDFYSEAFK